MIEQPENTKLEIFSFEHNTREIFCAIIRDENFGPLVEGIRRYGKNSFSAIKLVIKAYNNYLN